MTASHPAPAIVASDLDEAIALVREQGLRVSSARRLLLEALFDADGPRTADELAAGAGGAAATDPASVYRNLERLEAIGLVRHVHLGHGPGLYALSGSLADGYVVCDGCGKRKAATSEQLERVRSTVREEFGFEAAFSHFPIVGLCSACAKSA
ncbi:MAG: transcriptional repressor [Actinomycetota bacterium]|nr:transcriptional repressor [Actinomycetota bacterium]